MLFRSEEFDYTMSLMDFVDDIVHGTDTELRSCNNVFQTITVITGQQRQQREHQGNNQAKLPVQIKQTQTKPMTIMVSRVKTINTLLALLMDCSAICTMFIKTVPDGIS